MRAKQPKSKSAKQAVVKEDMHRFKHGTLKSGSGHKVTDRKQAVAIAMKQSGQSRDSSKKREKRLEGRPL